MRPRVLLLDEPTNALDPRSQVWLLEVLDDVEAREGRTVVLATHDLSAAAESCDRMVVLSEEHAVVADGTPEDVLAQRDLLLVGQPDPRARPPARAARATCTRTSTAICTGDARRTRGAAPRAAQALTTRAHRAATPPTAGLQGAASSGECPSCGFLSQDPAFADAADVCPECRAIDGGRRQFPPDRQRRLDARIRRYDRDGEWEIIVILVAAFLEALLEDILDRIMAAARRRRGAPRARCSTRVRTIGTRISQALPDLTGVEFEEAAAEPGFRDFPRRWRKLREERNAFIHDARLP